MLIEAPVSLGELVDKITILEIKKSNIADPQKVANVVNELEHLDATLKMVLSEAQLADLADLKAELLSINRELWDIEDDIRDCERAGDFGQKFIELARSVYFTNDKRADTKKRINLTFGSELVEEKSYQAY